MLSPTLRRALLVLPLALVAGCSAFGVRGGRYLVLDTASGERVELSDMVDGLAAADVVFLGEEHDNDRGHDLQLWTIELLHQRRPAMVISMEQFESDVQGVLDAYLRGELGEPEFLRRARPWPNYEQHYRPIVEWAKERGVPVLAANIPRPLAAEVSRHGYWNVAGEPDSPWGLHVDEPEYRARFEAAMGGHGGGFDQARMDRFFAAQCIKDDKMAESIARAIEAGDEPDLLVVHLCGKFHSDHRLGTVSRLLRRLPGLEVAVVSMSSGSPLGRPLDPAEELAGDFLFRVPAM